MEPPACDLGATVEVAGVRRGSTRDGADGAA
jgi:hypothetical protein